MVDSFSFNELQFNRLFPFYLLINRELKIIASGKSFSKLCDLKNDDLFNQLFHIPRPLTLQPEFSELLTLQNQLVLLETNKAPKVLLRGQFEYLEQSDELLFVGSPWFGSMEQITERKLVVNDFAYHDPLIDLLHVLKSQEITNDDLKHLLSTISKQKKDLQKANKEVHDIALFPTQNPDPLIRIDFNGEVLRNNPAASVLDFFEFENHIYRNDEFFKLLAEKIDQSNPRWIVEAKSNNKEYSFVCVSMKEEGYINIYGRDITRQKKDQQKLERLSLVASANDNGVLFTTPQGTITWVNEGFCKLTGFTQEEIIGKSPVELCKGPLTDEATLSRILEAFFKGDGFSEEIIYYKKNKSWFWGRSVSQPIRNNSGNLTEFFGIIQDVTEEKASEEKLKVLSQIAEDNINAVVIADKDGRINWVNKSFIEMTGYSLEESIGKKPGHLLQGSETDKKTVDYLRNQITSGQPFNAEIVNYSKSGNKYWLRVQGQPIRNENGELTGFFALEEDITKEKESERMFRKALESIGDNVWEHDFRTGKTYFSKSENELLGFKTNELDNNHELWWNNVFEDDRYLLIENDKKYRDAEIDSHSLEYRIRSKDGSIRWVLDRGVVIEKDKAGKPLKITGTHTNITARKEFEQTLKANEEKYRGIIANMNLGLMELDADGRIEYANQTLIKMTGLNEKDVKGFEAIKFISEESVEEILERMRRRVIGISEAYEIRTNINGKKGWWFVSSAPKYKASGEFGGSIIICLDIAKQKELEQDLIKSREQAELLAKAKETFLANMSHEIRTPMNAIIGMGNQLAKTNLSEQQNFYLGTMNSAAENLLIIINDILDLSKIEAGKLSVEKIAFKPVEMIAKAMQVLVYKAEEKGLKLSNSFCDERLAPVLIGDPYRINQVLLNLLTNAIKFTDKGFVDITVEVINETPASQTIRTKVADTGIGMDAEFVEKLFDKFSQEYESVSRKYGGTGLGMSICKELVELMGGKIEVASMKGKGTEISFVIELLKGSIQDVSDSSRNNITVTRDFLKNKKILIADDNEMNRLVASTILKNYDAEIIEAVNGEEAVKITEEARPDLILMDIQMPVMNGYDASRQIRKLGYKNIPVIALTANAIKGENEKCFEAGMDDYLAKPFKEDDLMNVIAHWLQTEISTRKEIKQFPEMNEKKNLYFDLTGLKAISQGNDVFLHKMLYLFIEQGPATLNEIKLAYADGDFEKIKKLAHRLKPSLDNLGISSITNEIRELEANAIDYGYSEKMNELITKVDDTVHKAADGLLEYLKQNATQ